MNTPNLADDQKVGQRLMVGFDGVEFNDELKFYIQALKVGGLILFARNIASPEQVSALCSAAQDCAARCGQPPLLIGIDQEGGVVSRLKPPFTQFPGNPAMKSHADAIEFANITARELTRIGINMNMAPVLDVAPAGAPSVMRERAFVGDPNKVAQMGVRVIDHLQANGILAVGKHFPGIGRTVLDSHEDLPNLDIEQDLLWSSDLIPFQAAVNAKVSGLMLSHIRYSKLDPQWPASLSPAIASDLLRRQLGFNGLVLTDDLDMGAIAKHYDLHTIVDQCLSADIDILLICHPGPKIQYAFDQINSRLKRSELLADKGAQSLSRIMAVKEKSVLS